MNASVVAAARRFRARRRASSRRWLTRSLVAAVAMSVIAITGWFVANSSLVALRYVTVEGTSRLTAAEVLSAADIHAGTSLVRLDPGAVARRVERLAPVAVAHVTRRWPHGLIIRVVERRPAGVVVTGGHAELLDATGVAFASVASAPAGLVQVNVHEPVPGPGAAAARAAMDVLSELPAAVRVHVTRVSAPSVDSVSVRLADGAIVVWGSTADASTKSAVLRTLMRRTAQVYDVSTPSVAVTRG